MLEISIVSRQGVHLEGGAAAKFGVDGGTIGRADTNRLVLDDPDRTVSRVHAQVACRNGIYLIIDRGSNPLQLNGQAIGAGNEAPLSLGDRLLIGSFELAVSALQAPGAAATAGASVAPAAAAPPVPSADDPFADLLDGLVASPPHASAAPAAAQVTDPLGGQFADPMNAGRRGPSGADDPFADLLGSASGTSQHADGARRQTDDLSDLIAPAHSGKADSIDALFGLGSPSMGTDPLAVNPLADPLMQPNTAGALDPLAALQQSMPRVAQPRSDHLPIDNFGFTPPKANILATPDPLALRGGSFTPEQPPERVQIGIAPAAAPFDPLQGFDDLLPPPMSEPIGAPAPAQNLMAPASAGAALGESPAAPMERVSASFDLGRARRSHPPMAHPAESTPALPPGTESAGRAAGEADLLAAFLRGLGSLQQAPSVLTPGLMERIGHMLRTSTEGTLQLLLTRQEFKREVRAQVTMIAAQANNPLKFSPTVDVALAHLLGPGVRGFMPAEAAMRDAYQDLRAHEFGVMVGMRAALAHVIEQFEPQALEKNIASKSKLDAIFSASRKAKLWDQFVALYGSIAKEAEDDFHSLFGKAFLKAYEEQMERLKSADVGQG